MKNMNRYNKRNYYDKNHNLDKKNRLIYTLVIISIILLFVINKSYYENKNLSIEIERLNYDINEKDSMIYILNTEIESLKPKTIKVIEKEKPKFFFTRTKKDTTKTSAKPIVPVVTTPVSDSL